MGNKDAGWGGGRNRGLGVEYGVGGRVGRRIKGAGYGVGGTELVWPSGKALP